MSSTDAERQRRSRAHRKGDHSLCLPGRCPVVTPRDNRPPQRLVEVGPGDLGLRGARLYAEVSAAWPGMTALHRELLLETCRMADRLDQLDVMLAGGDWLRFHASPTNENEVRVYIDRLLTEARECAAAFRQGIETLAKAQREAANGKSESDGKPDVLDEIAKKMKERAERAGKAAG